MTLHSNAAHHRCVNRRLPLVAGSGLSRSHARVHTATSDGEQGATAAALAMPSAAQLELEVEQTLRPAGKLAAQTARFALSAGAAAGAATGPLSDLLTQLQGVYELLQSARSRPEWVADFVAFLNALEEEAVDALRREQRGGRMGKAQSDRRIRSDIAALVERLEDCHQLMHDILARPPFLAAILAARDQAELKRTRDELEQLKQAALYGQLLAAAVDVRHTGDAMAALEDELARARVVPPRPVPAAADVRIRIPTSPTGAPQRPSILQSDNAAAASAAPAAAAAAAAVAATLVASAKLGDSIAALADQQPLTSFKLLRGAALGVSALDQRTRACAEHGGGSAEAVVLAVERRQQPRAVAG